MSNQSVGKSEGLSFSGFLFFFFLLSLNSKERGPRYSGKAKV